ncbi:Glycine cleavage system H protein [compost metagenome]
MSVRFTPDHEWLRLEDNGELTVGITDYAQSALGDVVFVQLPDLETYEAGAGQRLSPRLGLVLPFPADRRQWPGQPDG